MRALLNPHLRNSQPHQRLLSLGQPQSAQEFLVLQHTQGCAERQGAGGGQALGGATSTPFCHREGLARLERRRPLGPPKESAGKQGEGRGAQLGAEEPRQLSHEWVPQWCQAEVTEESPAQDEEPTEKPPIR